MTASRSGGNPGLAILASGSGSTAEAFIHATQDGRVKAEVGLVICSNPPEKAGIFDRIAKLNKQYKLDIEILEISGRTHPKGIAGRGQTMSESTAICEKISRGKYDHVALMGYMRIVRGDLIAEYGWIPKFQSIYQARMTNTHPGPLPITLDTYGIHASERVLSLGLNTSHHTVHLVAEAVDEGPIIAAHPVDVYEGDTPKTLFERVQAVEKVALPYAIDNFLRIQGVCLGRS